MGRIHDYMSMAYEWLKRHKIISIMLIVSAVLMLFGRFASTGASTSAESSNVDKDARRSCVYGFVEEYGSWSWMDPFNTQRLDDFAHPDLVGEIMEERTARYASAEEAQDPEEAQALAAQRMQQAGVVKVASIESIDVLSNSDDSFQIEIRVSEYSFTNEGGLVRQEAFYSVDIERAKGAGMAAPYLVVRFIKN